MKKIPTLFIRDAENPQRVLDAVTPGCEWVPAGEGVATRKYDGTSCMIRDGLLFKRHEVKPGKPAPEGFEEVDRRQGRDGDIATGWVPVGDGPEDRWHREALAFNSRDGDWTLPDGTYELVGPKVQGNPEHADRHMLIGHRDAKRLGEWTQTSGDPVVTGGGVSYKARPDGYPVWTLVKDIPRDFAGLSEWLDGQDIEGVVWHHEDGRMAKIKLRDFGLRRGKQA